MTAPAPLSVIVVSRHRPAALLRCLTALAQQDHPALEVVVVADPEGAQAVRAQGLAVKLAVHDEANISAARNLGLSLAAAPVVAFIDDDACAEPTWARRLTTPFADPAVVAAAGFVRGRNGLSWQWRAAEVDALGADHPLEVTTTTHLAPSAPGRAVKTPGTNCAFRASALRAAGGFDPAFRFYLDESDLNLRLAGHGLTAIVPGAEVIHGYEASARRRADRVPLSLHEIAASTAVFLRRHAPDRLDEGHDLRRAGEEARIARHLAARRLTAEQAQALRDSFTAGWAEGLARPLGPLPPLPDPQAPFLPLPGTGPRPHVVIARRLWQRRRAEAQALAALARGQVVTVILLSPTARPHRASFDPRGFWLQRGGLFGPSLRDQPRFRWVGFAARVKSEVQRLADCRNFAQMLGS